LLPGVLRGVSIGKVT